MQKEYNVEQHKARAGTKQFLGSISLADLAESSVFQNQQLTAPPHNVKPSKE